MWDLNQKYFTFHFTVSPSRFIDWGSECVKEFFSLIICWQFSLLTHRLFTHQAFKGSFHEYWWMHWKLITGMCDVLMKPLILLLFFSLSVSTAPQLKPVSITDVSMNWEENTHKHTQNTNRKGGIWHSKVWPAQPLEQWRYWICYHKNN